MQQQCPGSLEIATKSILGYKLLQWWVFSIYKCLKNTSDYLTLQAHYVIPNMDIQCDLTKYTYFAYFPVSPVQLFYKYQPEQTGCVIWSLVSPGQLFCKHQPEETGCVIWSVVMRDTACYNCYDSTSAGGEGGLRLGHETVLHSVLPIEVMDLPSPPQEPSTSIKCQHIIWLSVIGNQTLTHTPHFFYSRHCSSTITQGRNPIRSWLRCVHQSIATLACNRQGSN